MDERLTYEQLIGDKLQSLPVPDMQDAIWLRVKTQLDMDMPEDGGDGSGGNAPQAPKTPAFIGWGLAVVVVALIAAFLLYKKAPKTKAKTKKADTTTQIIKPTIQSTSPPIEQNKTGNKSAPVIKETGQQNIITTEKTATENQPDVVLPANELKDTVQQMQPVTINTIQPKTDSVPPVKKGKGVKGLTAEDYRIVPKNKKE